VTPHLAADEDIPGGKNTHTEGCGGYLRYCVDLDANYCPAAA
jgi:hypothetical protein